MFAWAPPHLGLDVRELGHQFLPHDGPSQPGDLSHLGHVERLSSVRGGQVLSDLRGAEDTTEEEFKTRTSEDEAPSDGGPGSVPGHVQDHIQLVSIFC